MGVVAVQARVQRRLLAEGSGSMPTAVGVGPAVPFASVLGTSVAATTSDDRHALETGVNARLNVIRSVVVLGVVHQWSDGLGVVTMVVGTTLVRGEGDGSEVEGFEAFTCIAIGKRCRGLS